MAVNINPSDLQNLLVTLSSLYQTGYPNQALDVNQDVIRPTPIPNKPAGLSTPSSPWGTPAGAIPNPPAMTESPQGTPEDLSGGGRGGLGPGSGTYGQMTSAERSALGKAATGLGLAGLANPGLAALGYGIRGALANDAWGITSRRGEYGITEQDVRDAMDYGGAYAARDKESERQESEARKASALDAFSTPTDSITGGPKAPGETPTDPFGENRQESQDQGPGPGAGWGSSTPSSGFGAGEEASGQTGGGQTGGGESDGTGTGTAGGSGGDGSTGGDTRRLGGVRKASGKQTITTKWGEPSTGGETAIFIPEIMKRAGIQGKEREVIRTLKSMIQLLEGSQRQSAKAPAAKTAKGPTAKER